MIAEARLARAVVDQAIHDLGDCQFAGGAMLFLTRTLWEDGNLWAGWLNLSRPEIEAVVLVRLAKLRMSRQHLRGRERCLSEHVCRRVSASGRRLAEELIARGALDAGGTDAVLGTV